jgi:hypothetical protein
MAGRVHDAERSDEEIARRRDEALRRALSMPPKPHKDESRPGPKRKKSADPVMDRPKPTPARHPKAAKGRA